MCNAQYENDEKELAAEIGDFDIPPAKYQVWLFHYDENDSILDNENLLFTFDDPDPALAKAKELVLKEDELKKYATPKTAYFGLEVEAVVDLDGYEENVGTYFQEFIPVKKVFTK